MIKVLKFQEKVNQDGRSTPINKKLKICPNCGDYQEFVRPKVEFKGTVLSEESILPKPCYCEEQEQKKQRELQQKREDSEKLMERYKAADIPPRFLSWDFSKVDESENKQACQRYVDCFDINLLAGIGLILIGDKGRGKSTLCYCMMKELIKKGYTARIVSFSQIIRDLQATNSDKSQKSYKEVLSDFLKFDFTVIDDFGRETYTDKQLAVAFEFVNEMNKYMKCVALTANPESIHFMKSESFKYHLQFGAILDRLNEMCKINLFFKGKTFR